MKKTLNKNVSKLLTSAVCTTHMFTRVLTFVSKPLRTSVLKSGLVSCHAIEALAEPLH